MSLLKVTKENLHLQSGKSGAHIVTYAGYDMYTNMILCYYICILHAYHSNKPKDLGPPKLDWHIFVLAAKSTEFIRDFSSVEILDVAGQNLLCILSCVLTVRKLRNGAAWLLDKAMWKAMACYWFIDVHCICHWFVMVAKTQQNIQKNYDLTGSKGFQTVLVWTLRDFKQWWYDSC